MERTIDKIFEMKEDQQSFNSGQVFLCDTFLIAAKDSLTSNREEYLANEAWRVTSLQAIYQT